MKNTNKIKGILNFNQQGFLNFDELEIFPAGNGTDQIIIRVPMTEEKLPFDLESISVGDNINFYYEHPALKELIFYVCRFLNHSLLDTKENTCLVLLLTGMKVKSNLDEHNPQPSRLIHSI